MRFVATIGVAVVLGVACGGAVRDDGSDPGASGAGGSSAATGRGGTGASGGRIGFPVDAGSAPGPSGGSGGVFVDPGCPDAAPNPVLRECDPFATFDGCGPGRGCFPFVEYPDGPCETEQFGTVCAEVGSGQQGDSCDGGCAAGHVCVISSEGVQCVLMCPIEGDDRCPPGLVCEFLDVAGVGGCI